MDLLKSNIGAPVSAQDVLNKNMPGLKSKVGAATVKTGGGMGGANVLGAVTSGLSIISSLATPGALAQDADTSAEEAAMKDIGDWNIEKVNDYDTLQNLYQQSQSVNTLFNPDDWRPDGMQKIAGTFGDTLNGAMQGASFGGNFGGFGAGIGAALGGTAFMIKSLVESKLADDRAVARAAELHDLGEQRKEDARRSIAAQSFNVMGNMKDNALLNVAALGGPLHTSGEFSNGVRFIDEGGSHEQNPFGGVFQGIAADGIPNLVEEGEVVFNDYVFSKRLNVPDADKEMLGLKKNKDYSFAEAAEYIQRGSEERPNDHISKDTLKDMMGRLQGSQEILKQKQEERKFKREFAKLSPEEQIAVLAGASQQQFALGGHLFWNGGDYANRPAQYQDLSQRDWEELMFETYGPASDITYNPYATEGKTNPVVAGSLGQLVSTTKGFPGLSIDKYGNTQAANDRNVLDANGKPVGKIVTETPSESDSTNSGSSAGIGQFLRAAPILGSLLGTISAFTDKPNYSNIERAERRMNRVPYISPRPISNRMSYRPIDVNYIATQMGNQGIGTRRAIQESTLGNRAAALTGLLAAGYTGQTAVGDALMKAQQANLAQRMQVDEFNRGTDQYNSQQALEAAKVNQALDMQKAQTLLTTGQLRDQELAKVQAGRSAALTNLFQNIGNYGSDWIARNQAGAVAGSLGVTYNDLFKSLAQSSLGANVGAKGGPLFTIIKKGGKHA